MDLALILISNHELECERNKKHFLNFLNGTKIKNNFKREFLNKF